MSAVVALDIGLKRIGVSVCYDAKTILPSDPVMRKNRKQAADEISIILKEKNASVLVVGIPQGGTSEDEMRRRITHFCSLIETDLEPIFVDESFSSSEFKGLSDTKNKDGKLDSLAACEILRRYLCSKNS